MNKKDAAEFLGVSVRAVERYTQQGKLSVTYTKGRTRPVAEYRQDELDALRAEINANLYHQRPAHEKPNPANSEQAGGLVAISPAQALQRAPSEQSMTMFVAALSDALREAQTQRNGAGGAVSVADLAHKLMLSIDEAAALAGVSANHIYVAIRAGKLKAKIVGRGWRVKRPELDSYIKKL
jgi:excisionase family DNA binding protein